MEVLYFLGTMLCVGGAFFVSRTFRIVSERENVVKERFGKYQKTMEPGIHFMIPLLDRAAHVHDIREQVIDVPPQMCITKDNIQVEVDGIVYLKVVDPKDASYNVADYRSASVFLAQTTMRSEIGKLTLEETFSERERMNESIVREIDKASAPWGIKVMRYEIKNIHPSARVVETMEKQMEAERQKRAAITTSAGQREAKINISEGERTEAINLSEGEKIKRINEATGRAQEIRLLANAGAQGIAEVATAIRAPGGQAAVKAQLIEQFVTELGKVLEGADITVVPAEIAQLKTVAEGLAQVTQGMAPAMMAPSMPPVPFDPRGRR